MSKREYNTPDPDLLAEWRERNAARTARRSRQQPRFDGPQFVAKPTDEAELEAKGYVKVRTVGGYEWRKPETVQAVDFDAEPEPKTTEPQTIYELAQQAVNERKKQWPGGETVTVWESKRLRVRLSTYQGLILMDAVNGDPTKAERVRVGYYSPHTGWTWTLTEADYESWAARSKRLAGVAR